MNCKSEFKTNHIIKWIHFEFKKTSNRLLTVKLLHQNSTKQTTQCNVVENTELAMARQIILLVTRKISFKNLL